MTVAIAMAVRLSVTVRVGVAVGLSVSLTVTVAGAVIVMAVVLFPGGGNNSGKRCNSEFHYCKRVKVYLNSMRKMLLLNQKFAVWLFGFI